jgi:hypothetical protein
MLCIRPDFSRALMTETPRALVPEGIFYQRVRDLRGWKERTSAAKAVYHSFICGTAEAVPFPEN